ncbi:hypothetical protein H9Q72_013334 [Fusarium xylarioides]|uniref:Uncharacterized protein n=1 Tax=Fusarium xylarioides TaxID=221167 RepID=A0A9P7HD24_9HYPO|nr:hypothetical protein H9Q72_013334 [Fusarium xylarioides]
MAVLLQSVILFIIQVYLASADVQPRIHHNVKVEKTDPGVSIRGNQISILHADADGEKFYACNLDAGKILTRSDDKKWVACCLSGQRLVGVTETDFDCCDESDVVTGSSDAGYGCCPPGHTYDGTTCRRRQSSAVSGDPVPAEMKSGIIEGRCYELTFSDGLVLGIDAKAFYKVAKSVPEHRPGSFHKSIIIEDPIQQPNGNRDTKYWLDNSRDGNSIKRTENIEKAGLFTLKKSSDGYCLGGLHQGVDRADTEAGLRFLLGEENKDSCLLFKPVEVSCKMQAKRFDEPSCPPRITSEKHPDTIVEGSVGCLYWRSSGGPHIPDMARQPYIHYNYYAGHPQMGSIERGYARSSAEGGDGFGGSASAESGQPVERAERNNERKCN